MKALRPPRVLQVLEATLGGTRRYITDTFDALGPGPHNGLAYSLHRADAAFITLLERMRAADWQLYEIDMHREIDPRHDASCAMALRAVYANFQPDIVHAHSSKAGALARIATAGMRRRPGLAYTPNSIGVNLNRIYGSIERVLALRLDALVAVTPSEQRELNALKLLPPERVHVVVPAIRGDEFVPADRSAARAALGLPDLPTVVAIGRLAPQKDPLTFVDVVAALRKSVEARALWVGDGELRAAVERRIADAGLRDVVTITGWLDDVRPYVAAADIVVSTATYESFGYAVAEALAMERPVVASAITGTVDVVTSDETAQLYPGGDVARAAQLASRLLEDPAYAAAVARRNRERILTTFSIEAMRGGLNDVYAAVMRAQRRLPVENAARMSEVNA